MTEHFSGLNPSLMRIADLEFSVRTTNSLHNVGIRTLGDIMAKTEGELMRTSNFGRRCLTEVKEMLGTFGLALREGSVLSLEQQMQSALIRARAAKNNYETAMADVQRVAKLMVETPLKLNILEAELGRD